MQKHSAETLRSIYGAGYHKAKQEIESGEKQDPIVKKWFHSFNNGDVCWQGQIVEILRDGYYLVQLYSWLDGSASGGTKMVRFDKMTDWIFYDTNEDMVYNYDYNLRFKPVANVK